MTTPENIERDYQNRGSVSDAQQPDVYERSPDYDLTQDTLPDLDYKEIRGWTVIGYHAGHMDKKYAVDLCTMTWRRIK